MKDERETDEHTDTSVRGVMGKIYRSTICTCTLSPGSRILVIARLIRPLRFSDLAVVARSKVDEATLNFTKHQDFDMPTGGVSGDLSTENIVR